MLAGTFAALLVATAAAIYAMDPFQILRPARGTPNLYAVGEYQIPGIARHYSYDAVVTGSSTSNNFRPADFTAAFGWTAMNFALAGASIDDQRAVLDVSFASGQVRHVFWGVDPFAFRSREGDPFPFYLYRDPGWRTAPYFLSLGALQHGLASLVTPDASRLSLETWNEMRNWDGSYIYGRDRVLTAWQHPGAIGAIPLPPVAALANQVVDDTLVSVIRARPDVRFDIVLVPYSVLYYKMLLTDRPREFQSFCNLDLAVVARAGALPNVAVYNFRDAEDIVSNLDYFQDLLHSSGAVSHRIVEDVAAGRRRTSVESFAGVCEGIRRMAAAYQVPPG